MSTNTGATPRTHHRTPRCGRSIAAAAALLLTSCGALDSARDLGEIFFGGGGSIPREKLGVGNEFNPNPKGNAPEQALDIRNTLGIRHIRSTFYFDESFLPNEAASPNFARFDAIVGAIPDGVDLLPILAYAPRWLANRPDWKEVFINRYVIPVLDRYGRNGRIAGWEIWNEPDLFCSGRVSIIPSGVLDCSAADYVDLVRRVAPIVRARSGAPVVGAASVSINQSFPNNLRFNQEMVAAGILDLIDVYNFHWFGEQLEKLALGVQDFLNGTGKPTWCTESGTRGSTGHLSQAENVFPVLNERLNRLDRIYFFTYFDGDDQSRTFGLVSSEGIESSLYQFLRDNPA